FLFSRPMKTEQGHGHGRSGLRCGGPFSTRRGEFFEDAVDAALGLGMGRVFANLRDLERFSRGEPDFAARKSRLAAMSQSRHQEPWSCDAPSTIRTTFTVDVANLSATSGSADLPRLSSSE
ncbi:MAG: hypothetical protein KIT22_12490, partial [Verrucomicrobiae bacterium]|nr:hypothetical protein [Verrucomicrobiae bacterium]